MSQFVDLRLSQNANRPNLSLEINNTVKLLVGDIGIQTISVANTALASSVKVMLSGTVTFFQELEAPNTDAMVFLLIEKNGGDTFGSGILIYEEIVQPGTIDVQTIFPASVSCADFPTADEVNAGQIRYTLFITSTSTQFSADILLNGPTTFNGIASADS
ncbi:hypothetical protein [Paenibacillus herberti]|uniref:Exosporium protein C n=1 Tax=Paenibacillus herberti TaxID=1619309 RepID=A0A229P0S7_9BACL|nr:hypothetical protein [Paenibacillus herberti]OXM15489.1 hypothetical protein CGZ75_01755 [Paenibacillus herberti]